MARVLGYGGLGNTNGTRSFVGREEAAVEDEDKLIRKGSEFVSSSLVSKVESRGIRVRVYNAAIAVGAALIRLFSLSPRTVAQR